MASSQSNELPLCCCCCEWLGKYGGPATLPCGHNGCRDCFAHVQSCNALCPLCRQPFDRGLKLVCNTELRDLIAAATAGLMDDKTRDEGWECFPTAKVANEHYAQQLAAAGSGQLQQQQWQHNPSVPTGLRSLSSSSSSGGGGGASRGLPAAGHTSQAAAGLGALIVGSSSASSSRGAIAAQQVHEAFHQHPGLPLSAPSGPQSSVLQWDPPQWLPDSYATTCGGCHQPFKPLLRLRHHCRLCGKIWCDACSSRRLLMPPRFRERAPQRCCELCAALLEPLQPFLVAASAAACQPPVRDALDAISLRSWLNSPWGSCMADEVFKAANIVRAFTQALRPEVERGVPASLLRGARGLALLSVMRLGAGWSCTAGSGLVLTRQRSGAWSAPCAISCYGLGWGLALGGQLTDVLLVLRTDEAVRAFAAGATLGLGGSAGLALGPLGRTAEASLRLGGLSARGSVVGWSCSKGAFAGLCLEGTVSSVRHAVNQAFYGLPVTPRQLLLDCSVPAPPAAALLYDKLRQLAALWEQPWPHAAAAAAGQGCRLAATAAAADCKQKTAAGAGASSCASSSREWECALDAFEDDDDGGEEFPAVPRHRLRASDIAGAAAGGGEESDDLTQYAASAPPAPPDPHEEVWPGSLFGGSRHGGGGSSNQQQQQQAAPFRVQEATDDDEEPQHVLEW